MLNTHGLSLTLDDLTISIDNLQLTPGKLYGLFGLSGAGASDFLYLIGGLREPLRRSLPAEEGRLNRIESPLPESELRKVLLDGSPIFSLDTVSRARKVGFLFENPEWSMLGGSVIEDFWYSFSAVKLAVPPMRALAPYGLFEKRFQSTDTLSGGEKHRLNCASVFEIPRAVYLLDLSSSNLDRGFLGELLKWAQAAALRGSIVVIHGLRPDETPSGSDPLCIVSGKIYSMPPSMSEFPSLSTEEEFLSRSLRPRQVDGGEAPLLRTNRVWGRYSTAPLSCTLRPREILLVEGPNGSGKTTIGRLIVERKGHTAGDLHLEEDASPVMAFQHPEHCFFSNAINRELDNEELLAKCGISRDEMTNHPRNLDRSRQKLLSIAVTLSLSKRFAILDEPTCGMDYPGKLRFVDLLNFFPDLAVLIFTHDPALRALGRVVTLGDTEP